MQAICNPPRGCQLAYADLEAFPLSSKRAGYDMFKQKAVVEQVRAARVEEADVLHGSKPDGPNHRNMLQKLLGGVSTDWHSLRLRCAQDSLRLPVLAGWPLGRRVQPGQFSLHSLVGCADLQNAVPAGLHRSCVSPATLCCGCVPCVQLPRLRMLMRRRPACWSHLSCCQRARSRWCSSP